jgi:hypothetical protein
MRQSQYIHALVERFPDDPADGVLYVSMEYATAMHRCMCGCGEQIITPFDPTDWQMRYDGEAISLSPSIGNWSAPCRSHYWLVDGRVRCSRPWSDAEIKDGRARERLAKTRRFNTAGPPAEAASEAAHRWSSRLVPRSRRWSR